MKTEININSIEDTINFATKLAKQISAGEIITFKGNLGSGKTLICKYIISILVGSETQVTSPTFQLVQIYEKENGKIYHYDLYRLKSSDEIYELGIEDAFNGTNIALIEWPEIITNLLPKKIIDIEIIFQENGRKIIIDDHTNRIKL